MPAMARFFASLFGGSKPKRPAVRPPRPPPPAPPARREQPKAQPAELTPAERARYILHAMQVNRCRDSVMRQFDDDDELRRLAQLVRSLLNQGREPDDNR
jgi:hypothetical protein